MILTNLIDRMGEWNPQIFRELKERLTLKNIGLAAAGSIVVQAFVWLYFNSQLPIVQMVTEKGASVIKETSSRYCVEKLPTSQDDAYNRYHYAKCQLSQFGGFEIDWQIWWSDVFVCLSWMLPLGLLLGSVYLLVADLVQEEKRGTLNFIRLSPQSPRNVFVGKILGVPILVYLAAAVMLPLHLGAGVAAGADVPLLAAWYATIGALWLLLASAATLYVLVGGIQAIVTVGAIAWPVGMMVALINLYATGAIEHAKWMIDSEWVEWWYWLPISHSAISMYAAIVGSCVVATYWVWQALERRYLNPTATIVPKSQSYVMNLGVQVAIAGFVLPVVFSNSQLYSKESVITGWAAIDFIALFFLIPLLLPSKQALQDWSRYRRERSANRARKLWQRDLVKDLLFNDKSPALLAIAINLGIALVLWLPTILISILTKGYATRVIASACIATSLILIYATIAHLGQFLKFKKRNLWIVGIVVGLMLLPIGCAFVVSPSGSPTGIAAILILFSPFAPIGIFNLAGSTILATFATQLVMLAGLTRLLQRKLQLSGQSETKQLLANS